MDRAAAAAPQDLPFTHEVRFAVVLYGGISLAIYMNGIAQELLRMMRGSEGEADAKDQVAQIYRDLSSAVRHPGAPADTTGRCRFIVDIISGSSAGGINGIALAKAIAQGNRDLGALRSAWIEEAAFDNLLSDNQRRPGGRVESLLSGDKMYDILCNALDRMSKDTNRVEAGFDDLLDLFVTATDLAGRDMPIQLTGTIVTEPVHKTVFHFRCGDGAQDFTPAYDPMLAFAARCTSSFPVAFPPMRYDAIPKDKQKDEFARFFGGAEDFRQRSYADGGYLDNRPFSHAIDLIPLRQNARPSQRKLLFVDPFPKDAKGDKGKSAVAQTFDFLTNARLAATTLPRYETIREDIRAITRINHRLDRLGALQDRWSMDRDKLGIPEKFAKPRDLKTMDLSDLVGRSDTGYGRCYPYYHHLRVYDASDQLAAMVARLAGQDPASDKFLIIRQFLRVWRENRFQAYRPFKTGMQSETVFLDDHDLGYRLRRLVHLRSHIDRRIGASGAPTGALHDLRSAVEAQLQTMRKLTDLHRSSQQELSQASDSLKGIFEADFTDIMLLPDFRCRYGTVQDRYKLAGCSGPIDAAMLDLGKVLRHAFAASSQAINGALEQAKDDDLDTVYQNFHWHDVETFPFLESTAAEEHAEVQIFRISPADNSMRGDPAKLAGVEFFAFGGFLSQEWREHDMLWGRLDGAERIVAALLPNPDQADLRKDFTDRLRAAIIKDELGGLSKLSRQTALLKAALVRGGFGNREAAALANEAEAIRTTPADDLKRQVLGVEGATDIDIARFQANYMDLRPVDPEVKDMANWAGRSVTILSRMFDDLPMEGLAGKARSRLALRLRMGAVLATKFAAVAMPGSYRRKAAEMIVATVFVAGAIMTLAGVFITGPTMWLGLGVMVATTLIAAALIWVGRHIRHRRYLDQPPQPWLAPGRWLLQALLLVFLCLGVWTAAEFAMHILNG